MDEKIIRRICTGCQNMYKETKVSEKYFDQLMEKTDVDYSSEDGIEIITKTGCCGECMNDSENNQGE